MINEGSHMALFFLHLVLYFSFFPFSIYLFCLYFLYSLLIFILSCIFGLIVPCMISSFVLDSFVFFFFVTSQCLSLCLSFKTWIPKGHCVKKNQLDAHFILSKFRQPLHVSGVSRPIIRRCNRKYTTIGTYFSFYMTVCCPGQQTVIWKE